jgi:RNA polymerase sigma-70 factor (ECF subfamily)
VDPDDFTLMEAVRADRAGAFEQFVQRYQRRLYRLAWVYFRHHEDALDAVQETMMKIYMARGRYRPRSHPYSWASRILANHCLDVIRRRRARPSESLEAAAESRPGFDPLAGEADETPESEHGRREFRRRVRDAVAELPRTQREIFMLRHFEEMSLGEIAMVRGCAVGTVKSSLHRAASAVRDRLLRHRDPVGEQGG